MCGSVFRIGAYTVRYTRDFNLFPHFEAGIGGNVSFYSLPQAIKPYYGNRPVGGNIFIRFRLKSSKEEASWGRDQLDSTKGAVEVQNYFFSVYLRRP